MLNKYWLKWKSKLYKEKNNEITEPASELGIICFGVECQDEVGD